tara:strand:- start:19 stop:432 length:414 start_codon:yes stop_codon:yes gene_type:complete
MPTGPHLVDLPVISEAGRGALGFVEAPEHLPFQPSRAFYLFDLPQGSRRGQHAHKADQQFLICLSGAFDVVAEFDGANQTLRLDSPAQGLYAPPMTWLDLTAIAPASILLVLTALPYDEGDYMRDYDAFRRAVSSAS